MSSILKFKQFNENKTDNIGVIFNKSGQPNFYKFKIGVYKILMFGGVNSTPIFDVAVAILKTSDNKSFYKKKDDFSNFLIDELEKMDIRNVSFITNVLMEKVDNKIVKDYIPSKIILNDYTIDYNSKGQLDLIFNS